MRQVSSKLLSGISPPSHITTMEHAVLQMTQEIAQYLETKFQALLRQDYTTHVSFPSHWNIHFLHEVDQIALILLEAFKNQGRIFNSLTLLQRISLTNLVQTSWDASRYCDCIAMNGLQPVAEQKISQRLPPIYDPPVHETKPFVVTDKHRNGLVWYLPQLISAQRQVSHTAGRTKPRGVTRWGWSLPAGHTSAGTQSGGSERWSMMPAAFSNAAGMAELSMADEACYRSQCGNPSVN